MSNFIIYFFIYYIISFVIGLIFYIYVYYIQKNKSDNYIYKLLKYKYIFLVCIFFSFILIPIIIYNIIYEKILRGKSKC